MYYNIINNHLKYVKLCILFETYVLCIFYLILVCFNVKVKDRSDLIYKCGGDKHGFLNTDANLKVMIMIYTRVRIYTCVHY